MYFNKIKIKEILIQNIFKLILEKEIFLLKQIFKFYSFIIFSNQEFVIKVNIFEVFGKLITNI